MSGTQDVRRENPANVSANVSTILPICEQLDFGDYEYLFLSAGGCKGPAYTARRKTTPARGTSGEDGVLQRKVLEVGDKVACKIGGCYSVFRVFSETEEFYNIRNEMCYGFDVRSVHLWKTEKSTDNTGSENNNKEGRPLEINNDISEAAAHNSNNSDAMDLKNEGSTTSVMDPKELESTTSEDWWEDDKRFSDNTSLSNRHAPPSVTFTCYGCNMPAFYSEDVRQIYPDSLTHVVLDKTILKKTRYWYCRGPQHVYPVGDKKAYCTDKVSCNCCGRQWGVLVRYNNCLLIFLKISSFCIYDLVGSKYNYQFWGNVPWKWPLLTKQAAKDFSKYIEDLDFPNAYNLNGTVGSLGGELSNNEVALSVPAEALDEGTSLEIKADTMALASYLYAPLMLMNKHERIANPGIQFAYIQEENEHILAQIFKKQLVLKIKHHAKNYQNVKVYICLENRESTVFVHAQHQEKLTEWYHNQMHLQQQPQIEPQPIECSVEVDSTHVHIRSNFMSYFICTETFSDDDKVCPPVAEIELYARYTDQYIEIYVATYSVTHTDHRHLQRFKSTMQNTGYLMASTQQIEFHEVERAPKNMLEITCTSGLQDGWQDARQQSRTQQSIIGDLYLLHLKHPGLMVAAPQMAAYLRVKPKDQDQKMIRISFQFRHVLDSFTGERKTRTVKGSPMVCNIDLNEVQQAMREVEQQVQLERETNKQKKQQTLGGAAKQEQEAEDEKAQGTYREEHLSKRGAEAEEIPCTEQNAEIKVRNHEEKTSRQHTPSMKDDNSKEE